MMSTVEIDGESYWTVGLPEIRRLPVSCADSRNATSSLSESIRFGRFLFHTIEASSLTEKLPASSKADNYPAMLEFSSAFQEVGKCFGVTDNCIPCESQRLKGSLSGNLITCTARIRNNHRNKA